MVKGNYLSYGVALLSAAAVTAVIYRRYARAHGSKKELTSLEFKEIMRVISRSVFTGLFEAAQIAQRIPSAKNEQLQSALVSAAIEDLQKVQERIISQLGLSESDLKNAQSKYYKKGDVEIDSIVDSIEEMFGMYSSWQFPVMPSSVIGFVAEPLTEWDVLLETVRKAMSLKADVIVGGEWDPERLSAVEEKVIKECGYPSPASLYNEVSKNINSNPSCKMDLVRVVLETQSRVKSATTD